MTADGFTDVAIIAVSFDDPSFVQPAANVFLDYQQPWVVIDESLKSYAGLPGH
jgi:hypothetical protein